MTRYRLYGPNTEDQEVDSEQMTVLVAMLAIEEGDGEPDPYRALAILKDLDTKGRYERHTKAGPVGIERLPEN